MFQFTTTNVINSYQDFTTGLPLWSLQTKTNKDGKETTTLNLKRINNFDKDNVVAIYKSVGHEGMPAKATVSLASLAELPDIKVGKMFRLSIYIRLAQSCQSSYYANDMVYKGKPFSVEFVWKGSAKKTAEHLEKIIKQYGLMVYEKPVVKVKAVDDTIVLTATDEYQRFHTVEVEEYMPDAYHGMGEYVSLISLEVKPSDYDEKKEEEYKHLDFSNGEIIQGVEGFGTYSWLLHNLRLPTTMRTRIYATNSDETPHAGAKYNEYVIHYCKNRGILGDNAVGDLVKSMTTHVLYVNQALLDTVPKGEEMEGVTYTDIESALKAIAPEGKLTEVRPNSLPEELDKP